MNEDLSMNLIEDGTCSNKKAGGKHMFVKLGRWWAHGADGFSVADLEMSGIPRILRPDLEHRGSGLGVHTPPFHVKGLKGP